MLMPPHAVESVKSISKQLSMGKEGVSSSENLARACASVVKVNSVYREVRASVDPYDDTEEPVSTIRAWIIGM